MRKKIRSITLIWLAAFAIIFIDTITRVSNDVSHDLDNAPVILDSALHGPPSGDCVRLAAVDDDHVQLSDAVRTAIERARDQRPVSQYCVGIKNIISDLKAPNAEYHYRIEGDNAAGQQHIVFSSLQLKKVLGFHIGIKERMSADGGYVVAERRVELLPLSASLNPHLLTPKQISLNTFAGDPEWAVSVMPHYPGKHVLHILHRESLFLGSTLLFEHTVNAGTVILEVEPNIDYYISFIVERVSPFFAFVVSLVAALATAFAWVQEKIRKARNLS